MPPKPSAAAWRSSGDRECLVLVPGPRLRHHLVAGELPRGGLEGALILGEFEIHVLSLCGQPCQRRALTGPLDHSPAIAKVEEFMAIKYGRPIESRVRVVPAEAKGRRETAPPLDLTTRLAAQPPHRMGAAHGARECAHHRRPDLAAVRRRRPPRAGRLDARRRAAVRRRDRARGRARGEARRSPASRCFPTPTRTCATSTAAKRSTPTIWSAGRSARSRRRCRRSACSATWRSIPTPATAMTA